MSRVSWIALDMDWETMTAHMQKMLLSTVSVRSSCVVFVGYFPVAILNYIVTISSSCLLYKGSIFVMNEFLTCKIKSFYLAH